MHLFTQAQLNHNMFNFKEWELRAYHTFYEMLSTKEIMFPCIPATQGVHLGQFRYGFINHPNDTSTATQVAAILKQYSLEYKTIGDYTSLIIFFNHQDNSDEENVISYEDKFWNLLNEVSLLDEKEWPKEIPKHAQHPLWEFCFHEERYFVFCATPSHVKRRSRSFPYFNLAITPRSVFEKFKTQPNSQAVKRMIRKRLNNYDSIAPHPSLKEYGEENNYEADQYFLRDDQSKQSKCPFH
ncbi:YqcI/YcgG family protein [Aquibacillus rhizosphaerae]|uniref:YqcI/YcgG family protein n=1 Tax=Aquibacillus rhizosphaerae TaxID=3051431 RepID=A0ABT7L5J3_9BACI|nr:YqcI/YcgG family protein [Aquibacillus sp. LR5S19]MDL4841136.1 YqcI/YcgG family protein [Aquibacillus sp. LR5S19]